VARENGEKESEKKRKEKLKSDVVMGAQGRFTHEPTAVTVKL
jgi:hypothetical protein